MSTDASAPPVDDRIDPRAWKICAVVLLGPLMAQRDSTVVNVSPSTRREDPHATTRIGAFTFAFAALVGLQAIVPAATTRLPLRINQPGAVARP